MTLSFCYGLDKASQTSSKITAPLNDWQVNASPVVSFWCNSAKVNKFLPTPLLIKGDIRKEQLKELKRNI